MTKNILEIAFPPPKKSIIFSYFRYDETAENPKYDETAENPKYDILQKTVNMMKLQKTQNMMKLYFFSPRTVDKAANTPKTLFSSIKCYFSPG